MSAEHTEQASPRKKQKAREKGDRPRSRDLLSAAGTLAGVVLLGTEAPRWVATWKESYQQFLFLGHAPGWEADNGVAAMLQLRAVSLELLSPLLLLGIIIVSATLAAGVLQGGGVSIHPDALQPKFDRLNPVTNLKNLFSSRSSVRLLKSLIPAAALSIFAIQKLHSLDAMAAMSLVRLQTMFADAYSLLIDASWILFIWAAVDFAFEWRAWEHRLKMSKQDLRDEYKETEGNPQVRGRIRGLQRQMRRQKLRADVSHATVVITNPTHFAVALSFDFDTMEAPRVLAKGRNLIAEQIKSEARWAGVPIVENPPLARSLYRSTEPGRPIPFDLYAAVAGILAFLYRQQVEERIRRERQAKTASRRTHVPPGEESAAGRTDGTQPANAGTLKLPPTAITDGSSHAESNSANPDHGKDQE